jgi:hypothetical protein
MITPPDESYVGAYVMFLTRDLPKSLARADLLPALQWATEYVRTASQMDQFHTKQLADNIFAQA